MLPSQIVALHCARCGSTQTTEWDVHFVKVSRSQANCSSCIESGFFYIMRMDVASPKCTSSRVQAMQSKLCKTAILQFGESMSKVSSAWRERNQNIRCV